MIRHVSVLTFLPGTSDAEIAEVETALRALPGKIPELTEYRFGRDADLSDGNASFGIVADFPSVAAFLAYRDHSAHQAVLRDTIKPILAHRSAVQYEIEPLG
ncbi:MAG TPA: Dabb family protein [Acidimicrobiia bacterium]